MLTTNQRGAIAEAAIAYEAVKLGIGVWRPLADERYDLIFDLRPGFLRVQCKSAVLRGNVVQVPLYSARRSANGFVKRVYFPDQIDAFAAFCAETRGCYFLAMPEFAGRTDVSLRLRATKNNQRTGVRWAKDYELAATLACRLGP
jgi:hypothetical protein